MLISDIHTDFSVLIPAAGVGERLGLGPQSATGVSWYAVAVVPGEKHNIKLTTSEDWRLAKVLTEYLQ